MRITTGGKNAHFVCRGRSGSELHPDKEAGGGRVQRGLLPQRRGAGEEHSFLTCGDLTLDLTGHTVSRGREEISLSAKEYALLEYLLYNKNRILSREMIEDHIWNYDYEGGTNVVDVYVSYLRRKIDDGRDVKLIRTVRGRGYQIRDPEA